MYIFAKWIYDNLVNIVESPKLKLVMQHTIQFAMKTTNIAYSKILYIQVVTPVGLTKM